MECYICELPKEVEMTIHAEATDEASACASRAAKEGADKETKKGVPWIDLYMMYYRAAFEHEYRRRAYIKTEETRDRLLATFPNKICRHHDDHSHYYDEDVEKKKVRGDFAKSKWPNPLRYNEGGRIGPPC
jgi:hypothetical protein